MNNNSIVLRILCLFLVSGCSSPSTEPRHQDGHEAWGQEWIVSTQGRATTDAVSEIYHSGGNIIDAAIATSFAISVERPHSTGLGGGGFMIYREAKTGKTYAIDFRERAPHASKEDMYLDSKGSVIPKKSLLGIYSSGVPGLVKGLIEIHKRFGKLDLNKITEPAVKLARNGLVVYPALAKALSEKAKDLSQFNSTKAVFLKNNDDPYREGEILIQSDLADTIEKIAKTKGKTFYTGEIALKIEKETNGWINKFDLKNYQVKWREPLRAQIKNFEVITMPPPSSGGIHLIEILNMLENEPLKQQGFQSAESTHRIASAMQRAFLDRARYLGDPDYIKVPVKTLISKEHARSLWSSFSPVSALKAEELENTTEVIPEHSETTHFSIMDRYGNVVVSTQTINGWFGSGMVVPGAGFLLNNEMDDFSSKPGSSNLFGAVGSKANAVHSGKTPLSSMSPTIVLENGKPRMALGAPGGTRIITCVAQLFLNHFIYGIPLYESIKALRIHQQWKPDVLSIESPGFKPEVEDRLKKMGWNIKKEGAGCALMAVTAENGRLHGVSETRDAGKAYGE